MSAGEGAGGDFRYVRRTDQSRFAELGPDERLSVKICDRSSGARGVAVQMVHTPSGGGSPEGLHTHVFEQVFYVLEGVMGVEIDGVAYEARSGDVVIFPEGVPHRNWAKGEEPTLHLAINAPAPELGAKIATPWRGSSA